MDLHSRGTHRRHQVPTITLRIPPDRHHHAAVGRVRARSHPCTLLRNLVVWTIPVLLWDAPSAALAKSVVFLRPCMRCSGGLSPRRWPTTPIVDIDVGVCPHHRVSPQSSNTCRIHTACGCHQHSAKLLPQHADPSPHNSICGRLMSTSVCLPPALPNCKLMHRAEK